MRKYLLNKLVAYFVDKDFRIVVRVLWKQFRARYNMMYTLPESAEMLNQEFDELIDLEYIAMRKQNNLMFSSPKYWIKEDGEMNVFTIMKRDNWFMNIRINGELPVSRQRKAINTLVGALNKENP